MDEKYGSVSADGVHNKNETPYQTVQVPSHLYH